MGTAAGQKLHDTDLVVMKALANQKKARFETLTNTPFTGTAYADLPGASVTFTKILGGTQSDVEIEIAGQGYNSAGAAPIAYVFFLGVRVAGADWAVCRYFFNAALDHRQFAGSVRIPNLAAGALTVQLRGRNGSAGPTTTIGPDDLVVVTVREIPIVP